MLDSAELLALARRLSVGNGHSQPTDAELRRAVSTAYYALFHKVVGTAAERFMGPGQQNTAGFALLYRGFDHREMKTFCEALQVSTLKDKYKYHLRRSAISQDMRDFASVLPPLQDARHLADYDPAAQFLPAEVSSLVDAAEVALQAFDRVAVDERTDILALMMVGARG
jgi:uncharacterized protein (UPF0332 family)